MAKYEVVTQLSVTLIIEAENEEAAVKSAEYFVGGWCEPTYEMLDDYNSDHAPIEQVQDWDAVMTTAEEVE